MESIEVQTEERTATRQFACRELPGGNLETIGEVPAARALEQVAPTRHFSGLPLPHDMEVFMQHEFRIREEITRRSAQENLPRPRRCTDRPMATRVQRPLEDPDATDVFTEDDVEGGKPRGGRKG